MNLGILTKEDIETYQREGVLVVKQQFCEWIDSLQTGFEKVLTAPSANHKELCADGEQGRFFEDYCNWSSIPEFSDFLYHSVAAQIAGEAMNSAFTQIFHEHILVKEPGTAKPTPWHQDMPYYCVDGLKTASFWIPLDPVNDDNVLRALAGSHSWPKLVAPTSWKSGRNFYQSDDNNFIALPDIDANSESIVVPKLELGDAVLFNFKTLHSAPGNECHHRRRVFSARFFGDDVVYKDRGAITSPNFPGLSLHDGDAMCRELFPLAWQRDCQVE
jgi:ectoine hydroxylase-related dioxygenase (phytanoyl-CoA dioxygenase family)